MKWSIQMVSMALVFLFFTSCGGQSQKISSINGFAVLPKVIKGEAVATFAGGCFWAMQESLVQLKGVRLAISGYSGGTKADPTYDEVLRQQTGHAETVQVYYNPAILTYKQLVEAFFYAHDPTQLNRQGPDVGSDYRSIAFYRTQEELAVIRKVADQMEKHKVYKAFFVTEIEPFKVFYPAETSHQDYYGSHLWEPYIRTVSKPKVMKVKNKFPLLIKTAYQK